MSLENAPAADESPESPMASEGTVVSTPLESDQPNLAVCNGGKDPTTGRFLAGNRLASGSGVGRKTARFRGELFKAVTRAEYREVVGQLVSEAKRGRPWAIKLLLSYLAGSPEATTEGRLEILEMAILYSGGREE
jgi:hypothetical protein